MPSDGSLDYPGVQLVEQVDRRAGAQWRSVSPLTQLDQAAVGDHQDARFAITRTACRSVSSEPSRPDRFGGLVGARLTLVVEVLG